MRSCDRIPTRARRFFDLCLCSDTQPDLQCACMRHISPQKGETDTPEAHELRKVLRETQDRLKGVTRKGIDAMIFMSEGFTCREIGEMYGTNANNVTAWISKARKALRLDVKFMRFAAELEV